MKLPARWLSCLLAILVTCAHGAASSIEIPYRVGGQLKTCRQLGELDQILESKDPKYLMQWPDQTYTEVRSWIKGCALSDSLDVTSRRLEQLETARTEKHRITEAAESAQRARDAADVAAVNRQETDERQAELTRQEAARAAADAPRLALERCRASDEFRLFSLQERVINDVATKESAQHAIDAERRVGNASGYVEPARLHGAGQVLVQAEDDLQATWVEYRRRGGTAASPGSVSHTISNPCAP